MEVAANSSSAFSRSQKLRLAVAMALYGAVLVAALTTLSDWRIRLVTVAIVLLFAGRTLWQPRRGPSEELRGRAADVEDRPM